MCAVDNGYFETKIKNSEGMKKFRSKIQKTNGEFMENNIIEYQGETYTIGEGKDDICNDKTKGLVHKLCTLKALGDMTDYSEEFNLVTDLPLGHYKNKQFREEFERYMTTPEINVINHNGKTKRIAIKKCTIVPQGLAALYANDVRQYKDKMLAVLDIGGKTIDGCVVEGLKPIKESIFTINLGTIILENRIKTALNQKFLLDIQDYEVPYLMKDGIPGLEVESRIVIEEVYNEYFDQLIREMTAKNWSIETLPMVGVGGGLLRLKDIIEFYLPKLKPSQNPIYDNVLGLYNIGKVV